MKGPGMDVVGKLGEKSPFAPCETGLRALSFYVIEWDEIATRLDVKIGANQYGVVFRSHPPRPPQQSEKIAADSDLMTPKSGVIDSFNIKAAKEDIIAALEELVADLKADEQPTGS